MKFILGYVNMANNDVHELNMEFDTMIRLIAYVNVNYVGWSSYGVIVLSTKENH